MMENYPGSFTITIPEQIPDIKIGGETRRHIYLTVKKRCIISSNIQVLIK
ncbi:MAG: hypothetical protein IPF72_06715 [Chitinophagaceae bacterium]|nr:hypothetical protein [Chitinophagaceae bacterium]